MTVAGIYPQAHNANAPGVGITEGAVTVSTRQSGGVCGGYLTDPSVAPLGAATQGVRPLPRTYHRNRTEGLAHRAKLRTFLLPRLTVGCRLPSSSLLALWLGCCQQQAQYHLRRVLDEDGIGTCCRGNGAGGRLYVTSLPEERIAA